MGRVETLLGYSERNSFERYRFYLQNASKGLLELRYAPGGWGDAKYTLKRNAEFMGIVRSISFNELSFVKDARDYVRDVYEMQGIDGKIIFTVTRLNDLTGIYDTYFTGKLDLSVYKISETEVTCQVLDTSFAEKVNNRKGIKVNIYDRTSIEGLEINAYINEDTRRIKLPTSDLWLYAQYVRNDPYISTNANHYVPLFLNPGSDFPEAQSQNINTTDPFFLNATDSRTIVIQGHINGTVENSIESTFLTITFNLYVGGVLSGSWSDSITGQKTLEFNTFIYKQFDITTGQDAYIEAVISVGWPYTLSPTTTYLNNTTYGNKIYMREIAYSLDPVWVKSWPIYETFWRVVQKITDQVVCFYSEFFGRTDTPIDSYPSDGQLGHIAKGKLIKDAESAYNHVYQEYSGYTMELSLYDLFKSLKSIYCIGLGIETINGYERVRIEHLTYFFDSNVVLDLTDSVRELSVGKEVYTEMHFNYIETGYNSFEYHSIAGAIFEINAKSSYTTVLSSVDNKLDLISKYRADTNGINLLRSESGNTEDTKGEEDIFIIDSIRTDIDPDWLARTNEDFDSIIGVAGVELGFNLLLTPKRNLIRNGAIIRSGLNKSLGTKIRWQVSDKNANLTTKFNTDTAEVVENSDLWVNELTEPFYLPEMYTFECVMRNSQLETIKTNPKGLIKIGSLYGWIWELNTGSEVDKAEIKLLRCNTNVITPVE